MLRTPVPEATVDEDRDLLTSENDIGSSSEIGKGCDGHAVTKSARVEKVTYGKLRGRVP